MAGTYWLTILPETSKLESEIRAAFDRVAKTAIKPKIEPTGATEAGQKAGDEITSEIEKKVKKTKVPKVEPKVEPKVDQGAAEKAGKDAGDTITTALQKVGSEVGRGVGKGIAEGIPEGMGGAAGKISDVLRATLPALGSALGTALGTAVGVRLREGVEQNFDAALGRGSAKFDELLNKLANSPNKVVIPIGDGVAAAGGGSQLDRAGAAIMNGIKAAIAKVAPVAAAGVGVIIGSDIVTGIRTRLESAGAVVSDAIRTVGGKISSATDVGVFIGTRIAGGLKSASGTITEAAGFVTGTIGNLKSGIGDLKTSLGGDESWAAPGLDYLNDALQTATPLVTGLTTASTLAAGAADLMTMATKVAAGAQWLFNAALTANPIGLVVAAVAALVAGLVWFFTKTELGRKIWEGFTEYLKIAWEGIKTAFSVAWSAISAIWDGMVTKAGEVWQGIKDKFTGIVDFVKGLPSAIGNAAKGLWDGLKNGLVSVLNWIAGKWNSFADAMSLDLPGSMFDVKIPHLPTFANGGYTGNVPARRVAGVVHGGEHVIKASSTRLIENAYPGLLDYLNNKGRLPMGYYGGGRVELGNISGPGITSSEQQSMWDAIRTAFPDAVLTSATRTVMTEGHPDFHNAGRAIDISGPSMGKIAAWIAANYPNSLELIHSPFGHNIKDGQDVGDGNKFYGPDLMAAHQNHVHWALGRNANVDVGAEASANTGSSSSSGSTGSSSAGGSRSSSSGGSSGGGSASGSGADSGSGNDAQKRAGDLGQEFGKSLIGGILETIGLDGSVFSNPLEWPTVKSAMAGVNWLGKLLSGKNQPQGAAVNGVGAATDAGSGVAPIGDTSANFGNILGGVIPAAGSGGNGSPALAPGEFNPAVPGSAAPVDATMSAPDAAHQGTGAAPGPAVDNSINFNGDVGMDPTAVRTQMRAEQNARTRTTVVR